MDDATKTVSDRLDQQPVRRVQRGGTEYVLLGTAHVSRHSVDAVHAMAAAEEFDTIAVELCATRHRAMSDPEAWRKIDLFEVIKTGKAPMVVANLLLGAYQRRLAEQFGVEPGAEMKAAMEEADARDAKLALVDREIGVTLRRVYRSVGFFDRLSIFGGALTSLFASEEITEEEIEQLKQGDVLENTFGEFARQTPALYESLIAERDRYMACRLRQVGEESKKVLAVVGAGHLEGLEKHLAEDQAEPQPQIGKLSETPPRGGWLKYLPWLIVAIVLTGFAYGFSKSPELGMELIATWVLINGGMAAVGAALAGGHPLTIISAFVAAPLTSLNPTVGAGMATALVEAWVRRPRIGDFEKLRDDVVSFRGWWRNRVARTLLVFVFSNIGSSVATYIAGFRIFDKLS